MRVLLLLLVVAAAQARQLKQVAAGTDGEALMAIIPAVVKGDSCSDFMMGPATTLASTATALIQAYNEVEGYTTDFAIPNGLYVNVCQKAANGLLNIQINYLTKEDTDSGCPLVAEAMLLPEWADATGITVVSASCLAVVTVEHGK